MNNPGRLPAQGGVHIFKAEAYDVDGKQLSNVTFRWAGSDYTVASVDSATGRVLTQIPGKFTIFVEATAEDGSPAMCAADVVVEERYQDVMVSGHAVYPDGSPAAGATIRAAGGPSTLSQSDGSFTVLAGSAPHAEGAKITAAAVLKGDSGAGDAAVTNGSVKDVRIVLKAGAAPASSGLRPVYLFRIWPPGKPQDVGFLIFSSVHAKDGLFWFPDGSGGWYPKEGENLGLYRDEDCLCAVLRGYGKTSVDYNLYAYSISCAQNGPVQPPIQVQSSQVSPSVPASPAAAGNGQAVVVSELTGTGTITSSSGETHPLAGQSGIPPGASVRTGNASTVVLAFSGGSIARLAANSTARILAPEPGKTAPNIEIPDGSVVVDIRPASGSSPHDLPKGITRIFRLPSWARATGSMSRP